jgi:deazaflavin-dependent oxidoreductase (nitroreductase family)
VEEHDREGRGVAQNWNEKIITQFRQNGGKQVGSFGDRLLLLRTTGAKSGRERLNPLAFTRDGDDYVVVASKGGAPTHPDWYRNLLTNPDVVVEVGAERFAAKAVVAEGAEAARLFDQHASAMPGFHDYKKRTTRVLPVIRLTRSSGGRAVAP